MATMIVWWVIFDDGEWGPYVYQEDALHAAEHTRHLKYGDIRVVSCRVVSYHNRNVIERNVKTDITD